MLPNVKRKAARKTLVSKPAAAMVGFSIIAALWPCFSGGGQGAGPLMVHWLTALAHARMPLQSQPPHRWHSPVCQDPLPCPLPTGNW